MNEDWKLIGWIKFTWNKNEEKLENAPRQKRNIVDRKSFVDVLIKELKKAMESLGHRAKHSKTKTSFFWALKWLTIQKRVRII